ncbi:MAG: Hsp20/alpha crystallin family protein, partial [Thermoplasmata archaeon]
KKEEKEEKSEYYRCCERRYGEFSRSVALPSSVDRDKINASYHNGVLRIEMQKIPEAKARKIAVKTE